MIKVEVIGLAGAINDIKSLVGGGTVNASGNMRNIIYEGLMAGGEVLKEIAQAKCALAMDRGYATGKLMESIAVRNVSINGFVGTCVVGTSGIIYAAHREYGGEIRAKNVPTLAFEIAPGSWRFPVSVFHAPQPYMRPAMDEGQSPVRAAVMAAVEKEASAMGGF